MTVTVYTKPRCPQCIRVMTTFTSNGLEYDQAPIDERVRVLAEIKGWKAAPIVVSNEHPEYSFSGAQPQQIKDFITKHLED